jgi:HrpA-like RNA helicase
MNRFRKADADYDLELLNTNQKIAYLPIESYSKEILFTIDSNDVSIIIGETGCGKSTKIPEILYKAKTEFRVAHILPRKIATITIAQRVCKNLNLTLGKEIGYSVRFDYNYTNETKVKFLTEGMFIRELLMDPLLNSYNLILIDDCHERTINAELIFGFIKKVFKKRKDLKIVISSATLDYSSYLNFFSKHDGFKSDIFVVSGRTYPVDIFYLDKPIKNYVESAVLTAINIHKQNDRNSGDILVFLTGQEDINLFLELASLHHLNKSNILLMPLYSGLPMEKQLEVFQPTPHNKRKIVIATNIAEASVTIENISFIIDSCFVKMKFYDSKLDSDGLFIIPASKFSLNQRAGRAGRTRPGQCYRLITEFFYESLYEMTNPEILRSNLLEYVLRLKSMGIKNLKSFQMLTTPDPITLSRSLENLYYFGVIDQNADLTDLGHKVCDIPLDIRLAVTLLRSAELKFNCVEEVLIIVSMLSIQNLFFQPKNPVNLLKAKQNYGVVQGDHLTLLNIYKNYKNCRTSRSNFCKDLYLNEHLMKTVDDQISHLKPYLKKYNILIKSSVDSDGEDVLKSFLKGFFLNTAQKQMDGSYRCMRLGTVLHVHPTSVLYNILPEFVMFNEVTNTAKNYIKDLSAIQKEWIIEAGSHFYEDKTKKVILERHQNEIKIQYKNEEKLYTSNQSVSGQGFNSIFKKKSDNSKINISMNEDRNKDLSHYFDESNEDQETKKGDPQKRLYLNNCDDLKEKKFNSSQVNIDDLEEITMLRRMRNRK